ncbi:MAG: hypothetical protein ACI9F9_000032 [Candidatus Paceibacteria bacterium]|jgi:hypothetical protein
MLEEGAAHVMSASRNDPRLAVTREAIQGQTTYICQVVDQALVKLKPPLEQVPCGSRYQN